MSKCSGTPGTRDFGKRNWQNTVSIAAKSTVALEIKVPFLDLTNKSPRDAGTFVTSRLTTAFEAASTASGYTDVTIGVGGA